eukprot:GDKK01018982.1.p1 GENE.GDKK01018982.1~~GDKK01018982.1.p1  ORF type:complete len:252 (+),score=15.84 GDKK01018982.1:34-789(+)
MIPGHLVVALLTVFCLAVLSLGVSEEMPTNQTLLVDVTSSARVRGIRPTVLGKWRGTANTSANASVAPEIEKAKPQAPPSTTTTTTTDEQREDQPSFDNDEREGNEQKQPGKISNVEDDAPYPHEKDSDEKRPEELSALQKAYLQIIKEQPPLDDAYQLDERDPPTPDDITEDPLFPLFLSSLFKEELKAIAEEQKSAKAEEANLMKGERKLVQSCQGKGSGLMRLAEAKCPERGQCELGFECYESLFDPD